MVIERLLEYDRLCSLNQAIFTFSLLFQVSYQLKAKILARRAIFSQTKRTMQNRIQKPIQTIAVCTWTVRIAIRLVCL